VGVKGWTRIHRGAIVIGDHTVNTGDWIVADADGIVVITADTLDATLATGLERAAKEEHFFEELRAGQTTVALLSLDVTSISTH